MAKHPSSQPHRSRGLRGKTGATGAVGPAGPAGPVGRTGPKPDRADVLAMVEDQFAGLRKEMSLQLARMAQMQAQLDQIHAMLKKVVSEP